MTRFWWVRHGPTHAKTMVGWTDLPADLSDTARLERLHAALPHAPVISSDLMRTRKTAEALQGERPRLPDDPRLREFHFGDWENQSFDAIDSPECREFFERPGALRAPGGESWNDVSDRVNAACEALTGRHRDVIVVAHMGTILTQWARATGVAPYTALAQKIDTLSVTQIHWDGRRFHGVFVNHHP